MVPNIFLRTVITTVTTKFDKLQNADLVNLELDFLRSLVRLEFQLLEGACLTIVLEGLISFTYRLDFGDEPPWICLEFSIESLSNINSLKTGELLFSSGSPALRELSFPCYRVKAASADFEFVAVCQQVREESA